MKRRKQEKHEEKIKKRKIGKKNNKIKQEKILKNENKESKGNKIFFSEMKSKERKRIKDKKHRHNKMKSGKALPKLLEWSTLCVTRISILDFLFLTVKRKKKIFFKILYTLFFFPQQHTK